MLENIFLMIKDLRVELAYPDDGEKLEIDQLNSIIKKSIPFLMQSSNLEKSFTRDFLYDKSRALIINNKNYLIIPLPNNFILGLVFEREDNPKSYLNEVIRLYHEYKKEGVFTKNGEKINKELLNNLLLTLFIDLRKYSDELEVMYEEKNHIATFNGTPMIKIFVYGIDNAGKSSLMRLLATGKFDEDFFRPTRKFRITNINLDLGAKLVCWDMPGHQIFREDWLRGAQASNILLYVLDVNDKARYEEAKQSLWNMLNFYELQGLPLIFLVNKIDLVENAPSKKEIEKIFDLKNITRRSYQIIYSSLLNNQGINKLLTHIKRESRRLLIVNGMEVKSFPESS